MSLQPWREEQPHQLHMTLEINIALQDQQQLWIWLPSEQHMPQIDQPNTKLVRISELYQTIDSSMIKLDQIYYYMPRTSTQNWPHETNILGVTKNLIKHFNEEGLTFLPRVS